MGIPYLTFTNLLGTKAKEEKINKLKGDERKSVKFEDLLNKKYNENQLRIYDKIKNLIDNKIPVTTAFNSAECCDKFPKCLMGLTEGEHEFCISRYYEENGFKFIEIIEPYKGYCKGNFGRISSYVAPYYEKSGYENKLKRTHCKSSEKFVLELSDLCQVVSTISYPVFENSIKPPNYLSGWFENQTIILLDLIFQVCKILSSINEKF